MVRCSIYHFAVGGPVDDMRLTTLRAYDSVAFQNFSLDRDAAHDPPVEVS